MNVSYLGECSPDKTIHWTSKRNMKDRLEKERNGVNNARRRALYTSIFTNGALWQHRAEAACDVSEATVLAMHSDDLRHCVHRSYVHAGRPAGGLILATQQCNACTHTPLMTS